MKNTSRQAAQKPTSLQFNYNACLARACLQENERASRGEISQATARNFSSRCNRYLVPWFESCELDGSSPNWGSLFTSPSVSRLTSSTKRQVVQTAVRAFRQSENAYLEKLARQAPKLRTASVPRGGFTPQELLTLWRTARRMAQVGPEAMRIESTHRDTQGRLFARDAPIPVEMRWLIAFMVNSFMRPSDLKNLQHQHVEVVRGRYTYLRLRLPESKRHTETIITLRPAVRIYERLLALSQSRERASPMDYVFYPEVRNRKSAMMAMDHHFRRVLEHAGLRQGQRGQTRSLYSLRHTAITFRLLYGQGIDLLTLAKNARTSVAMIEKFYASELNPEMNVGMLQSRRGA
jgi:integrase